MKSIGRHMLVARQPVQRERRSVMDVICVDGITGALDVRHANGAVLPFKLLPGEKAVVSRIELPYCSNDTDREWRFELYNVWDAQKEPIHVVVPPRGHANGMVPRLDRLVYCNHVLAKWPDFEVYLGQEHAILGAHSTCVTAPGVSAYEAGELFHQEDPFLVFARERWSLFPGLQAHDIVEVSAQEPIFWISRHAVERITHYFRSCFGEVHYKSREKALTLVVPPLPSQTTSPTAFDGNKAFSGVVIALLVEYVVVAPAVPHCDMTEHPLKIIQNM